MEKIDAGPKGGTIAFRNNAFANPLALVQLINQHSRHHEGAARPEDRGHAATGRRRRTRLNGAKALLAQLAKLAEAA